MKWNMEENFSMEWNKEWKIFSMEWKKIASMEYIVKSFFIPFHTIPCLQYQLNKIAYKVTCLFFLH